MAKYFLDTRKSSEAEERQVMSIEAQIDELKEFAVKEKLEIVASLCESKTAKQPEKKSARTLRWPKANFSFFCACPTRPVRAQRGLELPLCIPFWHITLWNISYTLIMHNTMSKTLYSSEQKHLIERLKKARTEAGFDQKEVAERLGKTQSYISKIESGQRRVDIIQLKEFAKVYKKNISFFIV